MPNHICIRKVKNYKICRFFFQFRNDGVGNIISRHFRFQIVSRNIFRAWTKKSSFTIKFSFATTREEECHVRIFLCFRNSDLGFPRTFQNLTHCFLKNILIKNNFYILERFIIIRQSHIIQVQLFHSIFWKVLLREHFGNFATPVCTEIETNDHIVVFDFGNRKMILNTYNRFDKLIGHILIIRILNCLNEIFGFFSYPIYHHIISQLHTLPTLVSVHRIITTNHRSQFSGCGFHMI